MKKLLILDMDETLIHTQSFADNYITDDDCDFSFSLSEYSKYFTTKRQFLDEFMKYAFDNFKVAIWTAGGEEYASKVMEGCGVDTSKLEFFWTRDKCTIKVSNRTGLYYGVKNLSKVKKIGWNLDDVLIVDDVAETAENNYGNLIKIKPFYCQSNDTELLKLMSYLQKIKDSTNFRRIEKRGWSS